MIAIENEALKMCNKHQNSGHSGSKFAAILIKYECKCVHTNCLQAYQSSYSECQNKILIARIERQDLAFAATAHRISHSNLCMQIIYPHCL